jgi:guanine deaminase
MSNTNEDEIGSKEKLVFKNATIIQSKSHNELEFLTNKTVIVEKKTGIIIQLIENMDYTESPNDTVITLMPSQLLVPGFIDTHSHAPQFIFHGNGLDLPLLDWLKKYTFPCEARFADLNYARDAYYRSVENHIRFGSTTVAYYATLHLETSKLLADILIELGQRAFVGKVCMDRNAPDYYVEPSTEASIQSTKEFIEYVNSKKPSDKESLLVRPIITPRFAPTCSPNLLRALADIARKNNLLTQTHLSENNAEIEWVRELFPECSSYTNVYEKYEIMDVRCVLAHCIHLNDDEIKIIKKCHSGIAHCPTSNIQMQSGIMPMRKYLDMGLDVGLGSDVSGGYTPSMLDIIRQCIGLSKIINNKIDENKQKWQPITVAEAFYAATTGGARVLGIDRNVGKIEVGMEFDGLVINAEHFFNRCSHYSSLPEVFERFIYLGDDRNIESVYVRGRKIK